MSGIRQLFGTDGIRGVAGAYPLDRATVYHIGKALGHHLAKGPAGEVRIIIGQDTRESSRWIGDLMAAALISTGVKVSSAGVITTPGIAYLARAEGMSAGVVISASHNPWRDNGIKIFSGDGYKLPDSVEHAIEQEIFALAEKDDPPPDHVPAATLPGDARLRRDYVDWLVKSVEGVDLSRFRVLVDCANGAVTPVVHDVFSRCRVQATFTHDQPDGKNINEQCGALHPETVARAVAATVEGCDLGITFDGDADRALFSDAAGRVVNGDAVLLAAGRDMKARGRLRNDLVVATTMSNMGLEAALKRDGIRMLRAPVGDKYVLEEMQKNGATLGGEQSGHILFRDGEATTGDGLLTALRVMEIMARTNTPLADLVGDLKVFPQVIKNVRVKEKKPFQQVPEIANAIQIAERELGGNGRVIVRYSGTEALARVMVEAESDEQTHQISERLTQAIQKTLGL